MIQAKDTGIFIVVEGPDGCGKSTVSKYLAETLNSLGHRTTHTREVGSTPLGQRMRGIAFSSPAAPENMGEVLDPRARLLLCLAARIQNIVININPRVNDGEVVVCDRFNDSTFVYQGKEDKLTFLIKDIEQIEEMKFLARRPDYLIFLKCGGQVCIDRCNKRGEVDNATYKGDLERAVRISKHYEQRMADMAVKYPNHEIHVIDAEQDEAAVFLEIDQFVSRIHQKRLQAQTYQPLKAA